MLALREARRTTTRDVPIHGHLRQPTGRARIQRFERKDLRHSNSAIRALQKVDRLTVLIDGTVHVMASGAAWNAGPVEPPPCADWPCKLTPVLIDWPCHAAICITAQSTARTRMYRNCVARLVVFNVQ
jgi:hypothetical protein